MVAAPCVCYNACSFLLLTFALTLNASPLCAPKAGRGRRGSLGNIMGRRRREKEKRRKKITPRQGRVENSREAKLTNGKSFFLSCSSSSPSSPFFSPFPPLFFTFHFGNGEKEETSFDFSLFPPFSSSSEISCHRKKEASAPPSIPLFFLPPCFFPSFFSFLKSVFSFFPEEAR